MSITQGEWAKVDEGVVVRSGQRPDWRVGETPETSDIASDEILIGQGWLPVIDSMPELGEGQHVAGVNPIEMWLVDGASVRRTYTIENLPDPGPQPDPIAVVTMYQARTALIDAGLYQQADDAVAAMTGVEGEKARVAWEYAAELRRDHPLILSLGPALGLDDAAIDALFAVAAEIS